LIFFFISVQWNPVRYDEKQKRLYSKTTSLRASDEFDEEEQSPSVESMVLKLSLPIFYRFMYTQYSKPSCCDRMVT
jgi:hypothetical protein